MRGPLRHNHRYQAQDTPGTVVEPAALRAALARIVRLLLEVIGGRCLGGQLANLAEPSVLRYLRAAQRVGLGGPVVSRSVRCVPAGDEHEHGVDPAGGRLPEVFVEGEGLAAGRRTSLQRCCTRRARPRARPWDQGHQPAGALAQREVQGPGRGAGDRGDQGRADRLVPGHPPGRDARDVRDGELGRVLGLYRSVEIGGGSGTKSKPASPVECGFARKIRVGKAVLALGPILCGVCGTEFAPDEKIPTGDGTDEEDEPAADG
jgi:hypothetical protein